MDTHNLRVYELRRDFPVLTFSPEIAFQVGRLPCQLIGDSGCRTGVGPWTVPMKGYKLKLIEVSRIGEQHSLILWGVRIHGSNAKQPENWSRYDLVE